MIFLRFIFAYLLFGRFVYSEEGMWPFNNIPLKQIEGDYGVKLSQSWLDHVRKSCLRVSLGGSASFVSPQGLVMTNHHVGSRAIYHLSTGEDDLMEKGFLAKSFDQELKCPNLYVDQLISIRDVTDEVNRSGMETLSALEREEERKKAISSIREKAKNETGLHPEVVSLYQGAIYNLYLYKRYTDLRLVMAPEKGIAFFGGDDENFEYPRYDLDVCFFRVYEDGKPLVTSDYLKWSAKGPLPSQPLFVVGNPGKTSRLLTAANLQFVDEMDISWMNLWLSERIEDLEDFSQISAENKRIALQDLFSMKNSHKVYKNLQKELSESQLHQKKENEEKKLFQTVDPAPWNQLKNALEKAKIYYPTYLVLEGRGSNYSQLYSYAKTLVRLAAEKKLPNEERLREFIDPEIPALEMNLLSTEPVYKNLEEVFLIGSFKRVVAVLGKENPVIEVLLGGKSIEERVSSLLAGTKLEDLAFRKRLYENPEEVEKSIDPLIVLARAMDPFAREVRKKKEDQLDSVQNESYTQIAKVRFKMFGQSIYPDATFTLRFSIGSMRGYEENGFYVNPITTFGGAYLDAKAHSSKPPYQLPESWLSKKRAVKKKTPFNFVSTNDIIGGNSGSPVINHKGEVVGLIFDGNIQSLIWNFAYTSVQGRAVSVHSKGIIEALQTIYGAKKLVEELLSSRE